GTRTSGELYRAGGAGNEPQGEHRPSIHGAYTKSSVAISHSELPKNIIWPKRSGFAAQNAPATRRGAGDGGDAPGTSAASAKQHLAPVDHQTSNLDVRGALFAPRSACTSEGKKRGERCEHFASGPRARPRHQTPAHVGEDERVEFPLAARQ